MAASQEITKISTVLEYGATSGRERLNPQGFQGLGGSGATFKRSSWSKHFSLVRWFGLTSDITLHAGLYHFSWLNGNVAM